MDLTALLKLMAEKGISDIHFKANAVPAVRIHGKLVPASNLQKLSCKDIDTVVSGILTKEQQQYFSERDEMDLAYSLEGVSRFRVNLFRQRGTLSLSLRDRIVDCFPTHQTAQVRQQLALVLKGVVAQRLVSAKDGGGRYPATEVLIMNSLIRRHMLDGKMAEICKAMEAGQYYGMHTFDQDLLRLLSEGKIEEKEVLENATNPDDVALKLRGVGGIPAQ
jgi:Tfp pilus assembly pilus retraction ATPase PilT